MAPARLLALALLVMVPVQPATATDGPPPFAADLLRLSEILGAVAYLDRLCDNPEEGVWRRQMEALLVAQGLTGEERRRYVDVFNRGQRTFASVHRVCTAQTRAVLESYLAEGADLARRIDERFGRGGAGMVEEPLPSEQPPR